MAGAFLFVNEEWMTYMNADSTSNFSFFTSSYIVEPGDIEFGESLYSKDFRRQTRLLTDLAARYRIVCCTQQHLYSIHGQQIVKLVCAYIDVACSIGYRDESQTAFAVARCRRRCAVIVCALQHSIRNGRPFQTITNVSGAVRSTTSYTRTSTARSLV